MMHLAEAQLWMVVAGGFGFLVGLAAAFMYRGLKWDTAFLDGWEAAKGQANEELMDVIEENESAAEALALLSAMGADERRAA